MCQINECCRWCAVRVLSFCLFCTFDFPLHSICLLQVLVEELEQRITECHSKGLQDEDSLERASRAFATPASEFGFDFFFPFFILRGGNNSETVP